MTASAVFPTEQEREHVRELLVNQYALHEVQHHDPITDSNTATYGTCVVPKAHMVADIYKCLHQGVFGVGHNIQSPADFKQRLLRELDRAHPTDTEPVLEPVSPDGSVLRVNFRPFRAIFIGQELQGCDLLLGVCLASATMNSGSPDQFFGTLSLFRDLNKSRRLHAGGKTFAFPDLLVTRFFESIREVVSNSGLIPVLSHSPVYRSFNNPSYRVVQLEALLRSPLAFLVRDSHPYGAHHDN